MSNYGDSGKVILTAIGGGAWAFVWGLRRFRQKRLMQNTPTSTVRGAAIGLIELMGTARSRIPQKSPVQGIPCCWWRCVVQELQNTGKRRTWQTIKTIDSHELFFLEDATGSVLVNPLGAERHLREYELALNSATRTHLSPVLAQWGLNDMNWFGGTRNLRVCEEVIPEGSPIFIMGSLVTLQQNVDDREARFRAKVRQAKSDPVQMKAADANADGSVDAEEWDSYREKLKQDFLKAELARGQNAQGPQVIVMAPADSPFVVSVESEEDLLRGMAWLAPLAIFGGIAAVAGGFWIGLTVNWSPIILILIIVAGLSVGYHASGKGESKWQWLSWSYWR